MYRSVTELNRDELEELKMNYYVELTDAGEENVPYWEDIPDDIILDHYAGISFVEEDFFCNM